MDKFHLLYTDKNGKFHNEEKEFIDYYSCEKWMRKIKAKYFEIGLIDKDIKSALKQVLNIK